MITLFHRTQTDRAEAILRDGFKDAPSWYSDEHVGVWLSDVPLDAGDIAYLGPALLKVTLSLSEADLERFEWIEDCKGYREWLIPAQVVNANSTVKLLDEEAEAAIFDEMWAKRIIRAGL